jgi:dipeptidyl aminopeptidase/acylaminoacyl peptidase
VTTIEDVKLVPREVLFGNPTRTSPQISPDGTRLAWLAPRDAVLNVWLAPVDDMADARCVTDDTDRGIRMFSWDHSGERLLYVQDVGGDEDWHINGVNLETGETRDLTPFDGVQARIVKLSKHHPDTALVGINRDNPQLHDVYRLDLPSGELTKIVDNPGFIGFVATDDLKVRAALAPTEDGGMVILTRTDDDAEWQPLHTAGPEDALSTSPLAFDAAGERLLVVSSVEANAARLLWFDLTTAAQTVVAADDTYDVSGARLHPDTKTVEAVAFVRERTDWVVLDDAVADDFRALLALDDGDLSMMDHDRDDHTWLVAYDHDDGPVAFWAWDRDKQVASHLFTHRPELENYELATSEPFSFAARDHLQIHGYLTFPPRLRRASLPTVLVVHGGPWARDTWGFDPEAQWLANRGYLVVQVNFRGSTGYGKQFLNAGDREWGRKMHDDLLDAVGHVVDAGLADPQRVAIYGGSYGGYAALVGATFTPDVFTCAVDIVGPSNLKTLIESVPPYWAPMIAQFHNRVGNPETEADLLWERSPLSRAEQIRIPLLIAQGANDPRVKQAEAEQIVAVLRDKGIDHEYLLFPDEGHGFAKPVNRLRFYAAAEAFLAEHLGGRAEADGMLGDM